MPLKILHIDKSCTGCGACVSICPKNALKLQYSDTGFYKPTLDSSLCINCGLCEKVCQVFHTTENPVTSMPRHYYMAKAKDKSVVMQSSSGGAFSTIANYILGQGGVVFGARYNFSTERLEQCSTDNCSLEELRKSKYIESFTGYVFTEVLANLKLGRKVLYVGTPCQVEGLYNYLKLKRQDTSSLISVRFICHGVPSNKFFTEYKHYEETRHKSPMVAFDFRPKIKGWRSSDWRMTFRNGKTIEGPYYYYYYYYYFQSSLILRDCCYSCRRVLNDNADITIADFWGIGKYQPENKDQEGISLIISHSQRANEILKSLSGFEYLDPLPESSVQYITNEVNHREILWEDHNKFMEDVKKNGYMKCAVKGAWKKILFLKFKMKMHSLLKTVIHNG